LSRKFSISPPFFFFFPQSNVFAQDVRVFAGYEQSIGWMESIGWWGEELRAEQLQVPRTLLIAISPAWGEEATQMPVPVKKEFFYRCLLPLVTHANWLVRQRRAWLKEREAEIENGHPPRGQNLENLRLFAITLRVKTELEAGEITDSAEWLNIIGELLYRLDEIPAGLAIGQAAYESGWGTSRFTVEGNALFGQWTYGGKGMAPKQQRKELGDHKIATFTWPFDSVRGYYLNLSTHPSYEDFRKIRAKLRKDGKPLSSLTLADGLIRYSERGQEYVDSLKSLIRSNGFDLADSAQPRDEPLAFAMGAANEEAARAMQDRFEVMKADGEFDKIIAEMRLE
jgi:Bax protein